MLACEVPRVNFPDEVDRPDGIVLIVEDMILAGDVDVGDVIVLPDADDPVLVSRVRLGQGGLIFTVTSASSDSPEQERPVKMTTKVRLRKRGRDMAL
jgi:hypothetical protein